MARGKAAAQNANRRAAEALEQVEALKATLVAKQRVHDDEMNTLRLELQDTRNRLTREVKAISRDMIERVQQETAEQVRQCKADSDMRVRGAIRFLSQFIADDDVDAGPKWYEFAEALKLDLVTIHTELGVQNAVGRTGRRRLTKHSTGKCGCGNCKNGVKVIIQSTNPYEVSQ